MQALPEMDLVRLLSNPVGPLKAVLRWELPDSARSQLPNKRFATIGSEHRRAGWVVEAIVRVLDEQGKPMQARDIHKAVECLLKQSVCWSSVKAALAGNVGGTKPRFVRVAKGRYELAY